MGDCYAKHSYFTAQIREIIPWILEPSESLYLVPSPASRSSFCSSRSVLRHYMDRRRKTAAPKWNRQISTALAVRGTEGNNCGSVWPPRLRGGFFVGSLRANEIPGLIRPNSRGPEN